MSEHDGKRVGFWAPVLLLAGAATILLLPCAVPAPEPPPTWAESGIPVESHPPRGGLDATFLVAADTHFGAHGMAPRTERPGAPVEWVPIEPLLDRMVEEMRTVPGTAWPARLGGAVAKPFGLILCGDLTEGGVPSEWARFEEYFGRQGKSGRIPCPVFPGPGNHDYFGGSYVAQRIAARHGDVRYSFDREDLHLVCLGDAPGYGALRWLMGDLARTGRERPVVLFFHYPLVGPMSGSNWFGEGDYREHLARIIEGFNVVAIFHGHYHASGHYRWRGVDVYNVGSAKHGFNDFLVVRITDDRLTVASRRWNDTPRWWWVRSRPLGGASGPTIEEVDVRSGDWRRPLIPYPRAARRHR